MEFLNWVGIHWFLSIIILVIVLSFIIKVISVVTHQENEDL